MTEILLAASTTDGNTAPALSLDEIKRRVLNSLNSHHSRRVFENGLDAFLSWCRAAEGRQLETTAVQEFRAHLESRQLSSSTINVYLSAVRRLAAECAAAGCLDPHQAAGIARVKGARS